MTPHEIEILTKEVLSNGPFPYPDCFWLQKHANASNNIVPDLDMYFSNIVGFASTASNLETRNPQQIQDGLPRLRLGFFEKYPEHKSWELKINKHDTPKLEQQLRVANEIRLELLPILERLLATPRTERFHP